MRRAIIKLVKNIRAHRLLAVATFVGFAFLLLAPFDVVFAQDRTYIEPRLNVEIPGLDFGEKAVTSGDGVLSVSFLAIYIAAFYKYIVGVGLIFTAIMIVYGR